MRARLVVVMLLGCAVLLGVAPDDTALAQSAIAVEGQVVNGTEGREPPRGEEVMLHTFDRTSSPAETLTTTTGEEGRFRFEEFTLPEGGSYVLSLEYAGMLYTSMISQEQPGDEGVTVTVYESTRDLSAIRVERQVLVIADINADDREISAVEFLSLTNEGDRTLVPDLSNVEQMSFLRFSLPPEADELDVQSDLPEGDVIPVGTGFALTSPVTPGDHNVNFSFRFPYEGDAVSYQQSLLQGADVYQVMVPQRLPDIRVSPLSSAPDVDIRGSVYRVWEGEDFQPSDRVTLELSGLPQPPLLGRVGDAVSNTGFWYVAIPVVLGAALAFFLVYGVIRASRRAADGGEGAQGAE